MYSLWLWIITACTMYAKLTSQDVAKLRSYYVKPDIIDVTCQAHHVLFTTRCDVEGSLLCVIRCHNETGCWSVFYSTEDMVCVGCSTKYDYDYGLPAEPGTQYIVGKTPVREEAFDPNLYHSEGRMKFYEGVDVCVAAGGHLLQVDTAEENEFIAQLYPDDAGIVDPYKRGICHPAHRTFIQSSMIEALWVDVYVTDNNNRPIRLIPTWAYSEMENCTATCVLWVGLTDERTEGVWEWYNYTSTTGFTNWWEKFFRTEQRPDENCAAIIKVREYAWSDRDCSKTNTVICEFES